MKYFLLLSCLFLVGCGSSGPSNIVKDADKEALSEYDKALAEADKMAAGDTDPE
ncbi:MAG: hypothetical protein KDB00_09145 [Planctomycetales bacterium]|nr:hypothetical protein [Planctomycetales bacterium]